MNTKTAIVAALASSLFLAVGCGGKTESKEAKVKRVCEKMKTEDLAKCAGDKDCAASAVDKYGSCMSLAVTVGKSDSPPKTIEEEVAEKDKACVAGDLEACAMMGGAYMLGKGVPKDEAKGVGMLKAACEKDNARACEFYARAFERGITMAPDKVQFVAFMEKACTLGAGGACASRALQFETPDPARIPFLVRSCELKSKLGCIGIGAAYKNGGQGVDADPAKAKAYFKQACDLGDADSCAE